MLKTIKHWFEPPVFLDDEEKTRIARIVYTIFMGFVIISVLAILVDKQKTTIIILLIGNSLNISAYILNRLRMPRLAGFILLFIYLAAVTALMLVGNGIHDIAITGLPVLMIMSALVLERRGVIAFVILSIASAGLVTYAGMGGIPGINIRTPGHTYILEFVIVSLILGIAGLSSHTLIDQLIKSLVNSKTTEAQIVSIVENSPDLIFKINQNSRILLSNRNTRTYQGKRLSEFVLPDYRQSVEASLVQAFKDGKNVAMEMQVREVDGTYQWNSIRVAPVQSGGQVTSLVVIVTNIQAQQEAALQVRQSADRLAVLNEIGRAATELADLDSVLETIHRQVERVVPLDAFFVALYHPDTNMVSYPLVFDHGRRWYEPDSELLPEAYSSKVLQTGKSMLVLASPEDLERDRQQGDSIRIGDYEEISASMIYVPLFIKGRIIGTLSAQSYTSNAYTEDHLKLLEGVANQVAIAIENARLFSNVQKELTERQRAETRQEELIRELEQRNAELERLAYTLSHELRSPLITISGFLSYLHQDAISGNIKRLESDIRRIAEGVEKMRNLTNELIELMSVGRIVNEFGVIPLRNIVDEAVLLVRESIEEKHVAIMIADDLPHIYGDHKRLLEVFQNLLENAVKFMGGQPEPRIEIGQRIEKDAPPTIYVHDNGMGIDPRFSDRVFGIFQKLDAQSDGTGIGLALVKRIIEVHGGRIWVESEGLGRGSTFCFTLPDSRK